MADSPDKTPPSLSRWMIVGLIGFTTGVSPAVSEYDEYGEVSTFKMLLPLITMGVVLLTAAFARLFSRHRD